jgi:hypothetical protein
MLLAHLGAAHLGRGHGQTVVDYRQQARAVTCKNMDRIWRSRRSLRAMCIAAQDVWVLVRRWSQTMATASCWVSPEPAVNA